MLNDYIAGLLIERSGFELWPESAFCRWERRLALTLILSTQASMETVRETVTKCHSSLWWTSVQKKTSNPGHIKKLLEIIELALYIDLCACLHSLFSSLTSDYSTECFSVRMYTK